MTAPTLMTLARRLGAACRESGATVSVAESCTGGGLAAAITSVAGSSGWFDRGFITYSNEAKREMLGVPRAVLDRHGAVSEAVAGEMVRGVLRHSHCGMAVAITGIAGPGGATPGKPVGLVWIAWGRRGGAVRARRFQFRGGRAAVRRQSVVAALKGLLGTT